MAVRIETSFEQYVETPAAQAYTDLCDWEDHERWVPFTKVTVYSPEEFTARTGVGPLVLVDRMRLLERDDTTMSVTVEKLGPLLTGTAGFNVRPFSDETCVVRWTENVSVPLVPGFLAKPLSAATRVLFRRALRRLSR